MSDAANPIIVHLAALPQPQRDTLTALLATLRDLLPDAQECISYRMPCFRVSGVAVAGFDGFKHHCSYFPHSGNIVQHAARSRPRSSCWNRGVDVTPLASCNRQQLVASRRHWHAWANRCGSSCTI